MDCIQSAQRTVARADRQVIENRMRVEARIRQAGAGSLSHPLNHHGGALERVRAEFLAEYAERDRSNRRAPGSTADEERSEAAKRLDSRNSRRSAHF